MSLSSEILHFYILFCLTIISIYIPPYRQQRFWEISRKPKDYKKKNSEKENKKQIYVPSIKILHLSEVALFESWICSEHKNINSIHNIIVKQKECQTRVVKDE